MKRPIIALGGNSWDVYWQTRQHVLSRLASRGWPVVYSVGAFFVWDRFGEAWSAARWLDRSELLDGVRVHWPGRWQMRWPRFASWDNFIVRHHGWAMRRLASVLENERPIAYLFKPQFLSYLSAIRPCATVYHADDTFSLMGQWTAEAAMAQDALVNRADLVLASSRRMAAALRCDNAVRVLPNGADVEAFANAALLPCPGDVAAIPHPRIGYAGFLNEKIDYCLVYEIARRRPDWQWVFVGPRMGPRGLSALSSTYLARCESLPNVHFLGRKPHTDLPRYVQHMDVNVMCYRTTPGGWWTDIYPLKLHEYLAAGKPVIGSGIDAIREFSSVVAIAESVEEWIRAIEQAIATGGVGSPAERQRVAAANSWDRRIDTLEAWLGNLP